MNLRLLHPPQQFQKANDGNDKDNGHHNGGVHLVRRRSGGGAVYHDLGNINYCVIGPSKEFTRDKSAEMVAGALRSLGIHTARVNERHDIVFDGPLQNRNSTRGRDVENEDSSENVTKPLKVSGSAYKLTTSRALHHGTCLLSSNLDSVRNLLRSPARRYIKARGVPSVSSPVGNVQVSREAFQEAVIRQFADMHHLDSDVVVSTVGRAGIETNGDCVSAVLDEKDVEDIPEIQEGIKELKVGTSFDEIPTGLLNK